MILYPKQTAEEFKLSFDAISGKNQKSRDDLDMQLELLIDRITNLILLNKKNVIKVVNTFTKYRVNESIKNDKLADIIVEQYFAKNKKFADAMAALIMELDKKNVNFLGGLFDSGSSSGGSSSGSGGNAGAIIGAVGDLGTSGINAFNDAENREHARQMMQEQLKMKQLELAQQSMANNQKNQSSGSVLVPVLVIAGIGVLGFITYRIIKARKAR